MLVIEKVMFDSVKARARGPARVMETTLAFGMGRDTSQACREAWASGSIVI